MDIVQRLRLCNLIYAYSYTLNISALTVIESIKVLSEKTLTYRGNE